MATKLMVLRRDDVCTNCSLPLPAGTKAQWDSEAKSVTCVDCLATTPPDAALVAVESVEPEPQAIDVGDPGRSARKEYHRRHAKHEAQIEQKWGTGRIGKVAKFLSDDPQTTTAWASGASGEERVAQVLRERLGDTAVLLHDRKVPGTSGNIDHLAIAASGVWVIDAKKYQGKVEQRDVGGWFKTDLRLYVGGRDRTKTVKGLGWQVEAVSFALGTADIPIHSALSFVGAEWPIFFAKPLRLDGVWISWPTKLADLIADQGPLTSNDIDRIARHLSSRLPSK
jgi:hypothetical protein